MAVDRMDVGDAEDEAAHKYEAQGQASVTRSSVGQHNNVESEAGRNVSAESFRMKVVPWRVNHLVKLYDPASVAQSVRVYFDGEYLGDWTFPQASAEGLNESTFAIPDSVVGDRRDATFYLASVDEGPDVTSFMYWMYADTPAGLTRPIEMDVRDMVLVDFFDVGNKRSEVEHGYQPPEGSRVGTRLYTWTQPYMSFTETVRYTKVERTTESFRMKFLPGRDHLLIKAYDATSRRQRVGVSIDNIRLVKHWKLPDSFERYSEAGLMIPASTIGQRLDGVVRMELSGGTLGSNGFAYWLYANVPRLAE